MQFQEEMEALLERHVLNGLVNAPWVRTDDPESDDDDGEHGGDKRMKATNQTDWSDAVHCGSPCAGQPDRALEQAECEVGGLFCPRRIYAMISA